MAADSACFDSSLYQGEVDKLWVLPSVGLVGCCGEIGAMIQVIDWLQGKVDRGKKPDLPVILLAHSPRGIYPIPDEESGKGIDKIFIWCR